MAKTPRMQLPYPDENETSWYDEFSNGTMAGIDTSLYAAREDRNLMLQGGGEMTFSKATGIFSWSNPLRLFSYQNAWAWFINAGQVTLQDGQMMYVVLPRAPEANVAVPVQVANPPMPSTAGDSGIVICSRVGDRLYFRNSMVLADGENFNLIESGGRAGVVMGNSLLPTMGLGQSDLT